MKIIHLLYVAIVLLTVTVCDSKTPQQNNIATHTTSISDYNEKPDTTFCFLGKGKDIETGLFREENFDECPYDVTEDNIQFLYRKYEVTKVEGTDLYTVSPYKLYTTSLFFTRLLRFDNGKQVASRTFYAWRTPYIFKDGENYMIALNSLGATVGMNTSTFTCKTLLLDKYFNTVREQEYRYPEQKDPYYAYAYIDTLYVSGDGYNFRIINTGFDADDYYEYTGHISKDNNVTRSAKRNIKIIKEQ